MLVDAVGRTVFTKGSPRGGPFVFCDDGRVCGHNSGTAISPFRRSAKGPRHWVPSTHWPEGLAMSRPYLALACCSRSRTASRYLRLTTSRSPLTRVRRYSPPPIGVHA